MNSLRLFFCLLALLAGIVHAEDEGPVVRTRIAMNKAWKVTDSSLVLPATAHPKLFMSQQKFQSAAQRAAREPWAARQMQKIMAAADTALKEPVVIPDKPGEWSHHYVCKTCGIDLQETHEKNQCPRCRKEYSGWPYDGVIAGRKHHRNIDHARDLALAWQLTGKQPYADKCREILLGYADRYNKYPIHDYRGGQMTRGAKLFAQTLDESVKMIPLVWAYDMVYNSPAMTDADRQHIENDLFRAAAKIIRRNDMSVSNWQSWHNAAIAAIGFTLGDKGMVDHAINGKSGIRFQMKKSVLPDGFWYEGTASYHFYALDALQWQALAMKSAGIDFYRESAFRSLYEAPLDYAFPDGRFPAVNDSDPISISSQSEFYEMAYAWYGDIKFGTVAAAGKRASLDAFLWGRDVLPSGKTAHPSSKVFPGLGAVMLRQDNPGNPLALHLDYGPHGGGHGHPDKLGIIFFANGQDVMPDAGRLAYGAPLHNQWYKTSLAHNTVIVDGKNQQPAEARLVSHDFTGSIKLATASCDTAYKDVALTRSVALAGEYLLDVVSGTSAEPHTWDLACHIQGKPSTSLQLHPVALSQKTNGYQVMANVRTDNSTTGTWTARFDGNEPAQKLTIAQAATAPRNVIFAEGVTGSDVTTCPLVITRQAGQSALWVSLIIPGDRQNIRWDCQPEGRDWVVTVSVPGRIDKFRLRDGQVVLSR